MAAEKRYKFNLTDDLGKNITTAGGFVYVTNAGSPQHAGLFDASGTAITGGAVAFSNGEVEFQVDKDDEPLDIHIYAPTGHYKVLESVTGNPYATVAINTDPTISVWRVPFSILDSGVSAASEYDTGIDVPIGALVSPRGIGLKVTAADATETIDVGFVTTDANGLLATASVATAAVVAGDAATSTLGALLATTGNEHDYAVTAAQNLSFTLTAGSDTAEGYILLPIITAGII